MPEVTVHDEVRQEEEDEALMDYNENEAPSSAKNNNTNITQQAVTVKESFTNPPVLLPTTTAARRRRSTATRTTVKQKEPEVVARRNARERRRVKLVNDGFLRLRKHVPTDPKNKKLSKVKTLRSAIDYIRQLQELLNHAGAGKAPIQLTVDVQAKLEVLQGPNGPGSSNTWFPSLDLNKKDGQEYKEFEDAFFTPSRILPRAPLQL